MFYGMTKYSFDADKNVFGPFSSTDEAWNYIEKMADEEYDRDVNENGYSSEIIKDKDSGEIILKNYFSHKTDVTEFFIFEMDKKSIYKQGENKA